MSAEHRYTWSEEFPSLDGLGLRGTLTTPESRELESRVVSVRERSSNRKARLKGSLESGLGRELGQFEWPRAVPAQQDSLITQPLVCPVSKNFAVPPHLAACTQEAVRSPHTHDDFPCRSRWVYMSRSRNCTGFCGSRSVGHSLPPRAGREYLLSAIRVPGERPLRAR